MDLIGIDVNLEVARSFFARLGEPRWRPRPIQERMVAAGRLGRKTGAASTTTRTASRTARPTPTQMASGRSSTRPISRARRADAPAVLTRLARRSPTRPPSRWGSGSLRRRTSTPRCASATTGRSARSSGASVLDGAVRSESSVSCAIFRARRIDPRRYSETGLAASSSRVHRRRCPGSRPSTESQDPARIRARPGDRRYWDLLGEGTRRRKQSRSPAPRS